MVLHITSCLEATSFYGSKLLFKFGFLLEKDKVNGFRHHFFRLKQIKSTITMISFFFQFMSRADDMGTFFSNKGLTLIMLILLLLKSSRTIRQIAFQYGFKKVIT
jgi:hypothetical protein